MSDLSKYSFIITASVRQAFALRDVVGHQCTILSLSEFLQEKVASGQSEASKAHGILSEFEEREIWEQVIARWEKCQSSPLVNRTSTARLAKQAFDLFVSYNLPDFDTEDMQTSETRAMKEWMEDYQSSIAKQGWLSSTLRDAFVMKEVIEGKISLPQSTAFYGFHAPSARVKELLSWAKDNGLPLLTFDEKDAKVSCSTYPQLNDEITACASWVKEKVASDPTSTIGVIVPDILKMKTRLQEVFDHVLVPESMSVPLQHHQRPYRLSIGEPLTNYALVKTFFSIFNLRLSSKFTFDQVSAFLRNPLLGGAKQERLQRAKLEVQLRKLGSKKISWSTLKRIANTQQYNGIDTNYYCPDLVLRMDAHESWLLQHSKGRFSYPDMASILRHTSDIWGLMDWSDDPQHGEIVEAFFGNDEGKGVLSDFARLGQTLNATTLMSAIAKIKRIAQESYFQPSSKSTNIQILSESDALGISFDAVWVIGLTASNWPSRTQPNPFILYELQSQYSVPHADADQELAYAKYTTQKIVKSASEVILSCHTTENGESIRPSSLMVEYSDLYEQGAEQLPFIKHAKHLAETSEKSFVVDNIAPALDMSKPIFGGTGLFKAQALCPFKGFVEHRLGVRDLETPEVGLSPSLRGDVLHLIFELFWKSVGDHSALQRLELSDTLDKEVAQAVAKALAIFEQRKPDVFTKRIIEVESRRLVPLVGQWMRDYEMPRLPFGNVEVETAHNVTIKGMSMKVKMDHRDVDSNTGAINIADNKTGQITADDWFGDRLIEPQMPLYAIIEHDAGNAINSVVFKRIKHDEMSIKGVADDANTYPKFRPNQDMGGVIAKWKLQIDDLADEYQQGVANISPVKETKACTYCALKPVCRYHLK